MKPTIHILATVRNAALVEAATLVFRTLRTGFPSAPVVVWGNALPWYAATEVAGAAAAAGARLVHTCAQSHDAWVEALLLRETRPFFIVDTDVVFFESLEEAFDGDRDIELAGRLEPEFLEESTGAVHVDRLHTAVMYVNPELLRPRMRAWSGRFPAPWGNTAQMGLVRQQFIPRGRQFPLFYDTTAGLWQAGLGVPLPEELDQTFEHLHCGTYVDVMTRYRGLKDLQAVHQAIYADPSRARGLRAEQARYYESRSVERRAESVKTRKGEEHDSKGDGRVQSRQPPRKVAGAVSHAQGGGAKAAAGGVLQKPLGKTETLAGVFVETTEGKESDAI